MNREKTTLEKCEENNPLLVAAKLRIHELEEHMATLEAKLARVEELHHKIVDIFLTLAKK